MQEKGDYDNLGSVDSRRSRKVKTGTLDHPSKLFSSSLLCHLDSIKYLFHFLLRLCSAVVFMQVRICISDQPRASRLVLSRINQPSVRGTREKESLYTVFPCEAKVRLRRETSKWFQLSGTVLEVGPTAKATAQPDPLEIAILRF